VKVWETLLAIVAGAVVVGLIAIHFGVIRW
jgi:hypothetical protein